MLAYYLMITKILIARLVDTFVTYAFISKMEIDFFKLRTRIKLFEFRFRTKWDNNYNPIYELDLCSSIVGYNLFYVVYNTTYT